MNRGAIERAWVTYRSIVVPANASQVQLDECRQAFFAGAAVLFSALFARNQSEAEIAQACRDIADELGDFGRNLDLKTCDVWFKPSPGKPS